MGICSKLKASHDGEKDKIRNLPDGIITRILSLLPTKNAVSTSVLSSRWNHYWTTIDSFDFDDNTLCHLTQANDNPGGFMMFIERVLERCDAPNIKKFRLSWYRSVDVHCLRAFISFALSRNVQELELEIRFCRVVELPLELFVSKSLEKMKLRVDYLFNVPLLEDYFPSLKSLHVEFLYPDHPNFNFCQKLLCRCPQLQELVIDVRSYYKKHILYKISGTAIKRLTLMVRAKSDQDIQHTFEITAPVLEKLYIMDDTCHFFLVGSFPQLKRTVIDLRNIEIYERTMYQMDRAVQILSGITSTKYLSLSLAATLIVQ
ncbi:F-box/LRR-repeat protein At4g14096-like [Spinacia oleracea]|uniref:F-box/LRR-repeat protein At4g14096-like n=1 Tax=Spinacia oleracea TaxID=3562 RepID=A0A9R0HSK3_SPIOL|nr:F-box/LRR-repeat protein At4g14096-like [Spinacia oleracea]